MKPPTATYRALICVMAFLCVGASLQHVRGQGEQNRYAADSLVAAARGIIESARYCALVTIDESGQPRVHTMDPFAPDDGMVVWLGTHRGSRKVSHIRNDPRVTLYYEVSAGAEELIHGHLEILRHHSP